MRRLLRAEEFIIGTGQRLSEPRGGTDHAPTGSPYCSRACLFLALPAIAQEGMPSAAIQREGGAEVLGTVVRGNATIIFQAAGTHGLDLNRLRIWSQFAEEHPKIATALAYKPSLIDDPGYVTKHPGGQCERSWLGATSRLRDGLRFRRPCNHRKKQHAMLYI
jgi:hypothetical protein